MTSSAPTQEQTEFSGENIKVLVRRKPHCIVELEVTAAPAMIQEARQAAIKNVKKNVLIPGFRKGKAPEDMIAKKYAPQVEKELHQQMADLAYIAAQRLVQIPRLNNNASVSFQMNQLTDEKGVLTFAFETEPQPPIVDPSLFILKPVNKAQVTEKEVKEAIRQMQYFYAKWTEITDRPIENGDTIMINLDTLGDDDQWTQVFNHVRFEVSTERMAKWMKDLVRGAKTGDVLEGISQPDEDASEADKAEFKPKKIRLAILRVEQAVLPPIDDEFAQKVGAPTVDAMHKSIEELLQSQANEKVLEEQREQINEFLTKTYGFDLPKSLIETEKKHRFQQALQNPKFKAEWDHLSNNDKKQIESNIELESAKAVGLFFLSHKIVKDAKIPITHKQIQDEAIATLQSFGKKQNDQIPKEIYALALSKIVLTQAQDYLLNASKPLTQETP